MGYGRIKLTGEAACGLKVHRFEAQFVAGAKLPELPQIRLDHRRRTHETAQAGAIRTQDHRHVAGEVDGADRIGVVVDVRGVQAGLAAVGAGPLRARPDQTHTGAAGVVVHLPIRVEERLDVVAGEEVRGAVRAVEDPQVPVVPVPGHGLPGNAPVSPAGSRPRCSTSPGRSTRPPWPPIRPRVKVARLPITNGAASPPCTRR
jgi:hypothetical protein